DNFLCEVISGFKINCEARIMNLIVLFISLLQVLCVYGILEEALSHFEPLHSLHVTHRIVKRSLDTSRVLEREIEFDVLDRHFHLKIKHKKPIISSGFKVTAVNKDGAERDVTPSLDNFYRGYDFGYPGKSKVSLYFDEEDTITASIQTPEETYLIEVSIVLCFSVYFCSKDVDRRKNFCEGIHVNNTDAEHSDGDNDEPWDDHRVKRQVLTSVPHTPTINTCPLYLVADYRYFRNMGKANIQKTTSYLLSLVDRIDNIYRETAFSYGFVGMGFEVKEIKIHEYPSTVAGHGIHYNEEKLAWDTKELLEVFSRNRKFLNFCLAHLFTHIPFSNGVLGLAYIGSPRTYSVGGVCSPGDYILSCASVLSAAFSEDRRVVAFCLGHLFTAVRFPTGTLGLSYVASRFRGDPGGICSHQVYYKGGRQLYLNTGWSSSVNRYNRSLLTDESLLVTAHGHNWGSEHDPDTAECSPNSFNGGKYIMYTYSVSGYDQNNKVFSNCSRRSMGAVLRYKSPLCFTELSGSFCGNFRIEQGEECDGGPKGRSGNDPCCDKYCQLKQNAVCRWFRVIFWVTVTMSVVRNVSINHYLKYVGLNSRIPVKQNNTALETAPPVLRQYTNLKTHRVSAGKGKCRRGVCLSFCESEGLHSCVCDNETQSCFWCCKETPTSICKPHPNNYTVPNGTACVMGYCDDQGVCKKQVHDLIERIWQIIESITPDTVVEFMRANIVGTVIVFSLVIWIPASCVVCHLDRKKKREDEKQRQWLRYDNRSLVLDDDQVSGNVAIHRTEGVRVRHSYQHVNIPRTSVRTSVRTDTVI
ncbi:hypothetical protein LSH36_43g05043, partial [Paralvinella palmiformis]